MINQSKLKKFAVTSRTKLIGLVSDKIDYYAAMDSTKAASLSISSEHSSLMQQLEKTSRLQLAEQAAYTWFNRFVALRFMDANDYTHPKIVTPQGSQSTIPEILQDAIGGIVPDGLKVSRQDVLNTLGDTSSGKDPQGLAYRKLLLASCNKLSSDMPEMFEQISDYTELLLPDDLLSAHSILSDVRDTITDDDCKDVEIIGWLYQYYISERKDEVFANFKKNKKAEAKDIPAATQLFTPHWIVRYLVENSLGRLWLLNNPHSKIAAKMPYCIVPETAEDDYLKVKSPTELKVCDPACGSGHMLTYAFDLLFEIYNEAGYSPLEIPELILKNNLYGVEIDQRAGSLANFALVMKAKSYNPQADISKLQPNICVLQNIVFTDGEIKEYMAAAGSDLFTSQLRSNLNAFAEADNFGSLITTTIPNPGELVSELDAKVSMNSLFLSNIHPKVMRFLKQAEFLSQKYHVVVANPPYMSGSNMNARLSQFAKDNFSNSKSDLFAMFIERCSQLVVEKCYFGMITMQSWMFLSSFEGLRKRVLDAGTIQNMAHLGSRAFDSIGGEVVSTTSFVVRNKVDASYEGVYLRLVTGGSEREKSDMMLESIADHGSEWYFSVNDREFAKIPGAPIAYWTPRKLLDAYDSHALLGAEANPRQGLTTSDNAKFVRQWFEVSLVNIGIGISDKNAALSSGKRWFPFNKGGEYRRWYGNIMEVVDWERDGARIKDLVCQKYPYLNGNPDFVTKNQDYYFTKGITWSKISAFKFSARYKPDGVIFSDAGECIFPSGIHFGYLGLLNSQISQTLLNILAPTINYKSTDIARIVVPESKYLEQADKVVRNLVDIVKSDWDDIETSPDFSSLPMVRNSDKISMKTTYSFLRQLWVTSTNSAKRLEEENNSVFIEAFNVEEEFSPSLSLSEVTLTVNPTYRYGDGKTESELESLLLRDTLCEYISYAIGCVMGRYSLDKTGLILANQGDGIETYNKLVPEPRFMADADGIIPILDDEWFPDDAIEQVKQFVKVTFGTEKYDENMQFIEESIGKNLRQYLVKDFYPEHVKRYKKRPIYWLFTSPKGHFRALIYMHRYRPDTLSTMRNEYLQPFIAKLEDKKSHSENMIPRAQNDREKIALQKDVERLSAMLADLREYEKKLTDVASRKIAIDLDDGVKVNYAKFSEVIAKVVGL